MNRAMILSIFVACISIQAIAQTGSITSISVQQRTDGSGMMDILFSLSGEEPLYTIYLEASLDNGQTYTPIDLVYVDNLEGPLAPGELYHLVWHAYSSFPDTFSEDAKLKITAISVMGGGVPCPGLPFFTDDRDDKIYNTVLIGNQCWMKENLNYAAAQSLCYDEYYVGEIFCNHYGRLYSWEWAMAGEESSNMVPSGVQGVCPAGWHLPSDAEWQIMLDYLMEEHELSNEWCELEGVAQALKSCRQVNSPLGDPCATDDHPRWEDSFNEECLETFFGTDDFGFSALPGGSSWSGDGYQNLGTYASWWSSTMTDGGQAFGRQLSDWGALYQIQPYTNLSLSIRCIRD
jgi:uncharacterized protein (TIGR02145 family)